MSETERDDDPVSPTAPSTSLLQSRWIAPISLGLAVISLGVAIWALMHKPGNPEPTSQQVADAKSRACAAYIVVHNAVALQTHVDLGSEPVAAQAVAANAHLAESAGASYLLDRLDPATPADLAGAIRSFANSLQDISIYVQAGVSNTDPAQAARLRDGDASSQRVADLCR